MSAPQDDRRPADDAAEAFVHRMAGALATDADALDRAEVAAIGNVFAALVAIRAPVLAGDEVLACALVHLGAFVAHRAGVPAHRFAVAQARRLQNVYDGGFVVETLGGDDAPGSTK